jgi:hypothetical protein
MKALIILLIFALIPVSQITAQSYEGSSDYDRAQDNDQNQPGAVLDNQAYEEAGDYSYGDESRVHDTNPDQSKSYQRYPEENDYSDPPVERNEFPEEYTDSPVEDSNYDNAPTQNYQDYEDSDGYDDY